MVDLTKIIKLCDTARCGVQEIDCLSSYGTEPEAPAKILADFCNQSLEARVRFHGFAGSPGTLYCFYLFSCPVYPGRTEDNNYGAKFAEFLTKNKLGTVVGTPVVRNLGWHSDHSNQAWLWAPDRDAILTWWTAYKEKHKLNKEAPEVKVSGGIEVVAPKNPIIEDFDEDEDIDDDIEDDDLDDDDDLCDCDECVAEREED